MSITTQDEPTAKQSLELSKNQEKYLWINSVKEKLNNKNESGAWKPKFKSDFLRRLDTRKALQILSNVILKIKRNENGDPVRLKYPFVACGNLQIKLVDFENVHTP